MSDDRPKRTFRFSITVEVGPDEEGYDDPVWIADAAWGALANMYGYHFWFDDITELTANDARA